MSEQKIDKTIVTNDVYGIRALLKNRPDFINKAIKANDVDELRELLQQGYKSDYKYPLSENTDPQIADLLDEYHYLPQGSTLSTLKFTLFLMGNKKIACTDFWDKPDLNPNGYYKNIDPIALYARDENVAMVNALIQRGAVGRPLNSLFVPISCRYFDGYDVIRLNDYIKQISNIFEDKYYSEYKINQRCQIAELFFSYPNQELEKELQSDVVKHRRTTLPFFAWAAKNNRTDLFSLIYFKRYFHLDKRSTIRVASVFGSTEFLVKASQDGLLNTRDIAVVCTIAAIRGNENLLTSLLASSTKREEGSADDDVCSNNDEIWDLNPLKWAIMNGQINIVELLLESGVPPGEYYDGLFYYYSYLSLAVYVANAAIVRLLIAYGANLNQQNEDGRSALHYAAKKNNLEILEILINAGADITLVDKEGLTFIKLITDNLVLQKIQEVIRAKNNSSLPVPDVSDEKSSQSTVKVIDLRLFKENPIQYKLNKLMQHYNELEVTYKEFKETVIKAYKNQSPPQQNDECHIQEADFSDCKSKQDQFLKLYEKTLKLHNFYCVGTMFPESCRIGVKEGFESYEQKIIGYQKDIIHEMSADSHGLAYYYNYPRPEDRNSSAIEINIK